MCVWLAKVLSEMTKFFERGKKAPAFLDKRRQKPSSSLV
jgi:hypothetical protein